MFDGPIENLVRQLSSLPGLGSRSARRIALTLLTAKHTKMAALTRALQDAADAIETCSICGNLDTANPCKICSNQTRDRHTVCVVGTVADLWAVERTGSFKGVYHVLGGVLSALDGVTPENLSIDPLLARIGSGEITEAVLALSATVDGQATAHYLMDRMEGTGVHVFRLAHGVPVGGALEYLDEGTIATAMKSRARM